MRGLAVLLGLVWGVWGVAAAQSGPVRYGYAAPGGAAYALDVYAPGNPTSPPRPAILFFHGGGWQTGDKSQFQQQAQILLQNTRLIVISANYPLNQDPLAATMAAQKAVCWVRQHAADLGIDPDHLALSGGSAGGQLAAAVGLLGETGIAECAGVRPPYANMLVLFNPVLELRASGWERRAGHSLLSVSPAELVQSHPAPPTLILQGTADRVAPIGRARGFVRAVIRAGGVAEIDEFAGRTHGFFNNAANGDLRASVMDVIAFMKKVGWAVE